MICLDNEFVQLLRLLGVDKSNINFTHRLIYIAIVIVAAYSIDYLCRKVIVPIITKITDKTQVKWDDYLFNDNFLKSICHFFPPIILYFLLPLAFPNNPLLATLVTKLCWIYIVIMTIKLLCSFVESIYLIVQSHERLRSHPLKGVFQMVKLVIICIGVIIIISSLINKDPLTILTGLGASAAILLLVFKDTIMGLVAGVQLSVNNMLRPGDWISMPKYGVDGVVFEVTLTTVKVQNWDNTIMTVPPYALVSDSFQNWRGMEESGGRRVKRSINIDMNTVHFCTSEQIKAIKENGWINENMENGPWVNLSVFRNYMEKYLRENNKVNNQMMLMVRQLQPTPTGLPIELYFFSKNKEWANYEILQADIMDYLLAILPEFGLKVFQSPTGEDLISVSRLLVK